MDIFRIEEKESFQIIGFKMTTTNQRNAGKKDIPAFWNEKRNCIKSTILPNMNQAPFGVFGVSVYNQDEKDARIFDYYIAVSSSNRYTEELCTYQVPKATWAIFPCTKETMAKTEVMAIMKHLPKSNYKPLNKGYITGKMKSLAPDIEYYEEGNAAEVWVAVERK